MIPLHLFIVAVALAVPAALVLGRWIGRTERKHDPLAYAEIQRSQRQRRLMASALHGPPQQSDQLH